MQPEIRKVNRGIQRLRPLVMFIGWSAGSGGDPGEALREHPLLFETSRKKNETCNFLGREAKHSGERRSPGLDVGTTQALPRQ